MRKPATFRRFTAVSAIGIAAVLILMYGSLASGVFGLSHLNILQTLLGIDQSPDHQLVIFEFRLPRILIGALVGCALGIAGAVLQAMTKNQLADPGILGIQAAVGLSVVCYMFIVQSSSEMMSGLSMFGMSVWGWVGGIVAAIFLFLFSRNRGELDPKRLILVGIAINSGFGAATLFVSLKMNPQDFEMATVWLSGSIYSASWEQVLSMLPWLAVVIPFLMWKAHTLNLLQLSEASIIGLGLKANRSRIILLLGAVGLVSCSVVVSGSIGFVGLIAPHIARGLVGIRHQAILPISGMVGMILVVAGDWIGRTIFAPAELPVGIVISIIGVPYFIFLLARSARSVKK